MAMSLRERRWYPALVAVGLVAVFAAWWCCPSLGSREFLFFGLGGVAAVAHFFYYQHLENARFFRSLFTQFNRRYDKLNGRIWRIHRDREKPDLTDRHKRALEDYFNLCAEEWFYFQAGYIDKRVWEAWLNGMSQFAGDKHIVLFWEEECKNQSYYGFPVDLVVRRGRELIESGKLKPLPPPKWAQTPTRSTGAEMDSDTAKPIQALD